MLTMPRKTKKDKVIARLRRELVSQRVSRVSRGKKAPPPLTLTSKLTSKPSPSPLSYPPGLIKKDLIKTLGLTMLAISLELGIYYLLKLEFLPF